MWTRLVLAGSVVLGLVGCAHDDRQWMKVNTSYTAAEFKKDYVECSRSGKLDDACMRGRGWVDMSPKMEQKAAEPERRSVPTGPGR